MEFFNIPFSNVTIMAFFLFLLAMLKIVKMRNSNSSTTNLPPGPKTLPIIGNIHQIIGSFPHISFKNLAKKYGSLMHLKLGEVSYIIVSSSEMAKEIMKTYDLTFCDRPSLLYPTIFSYNSTNISLSKYGEHWRQLRKICVVELLSAKRVQSFKSIREEEVSDLVKSINENEGSTVNLTRKIFSMTYGIMARTTFGKKHRHQQVFISAIEEIVSYLGKICIFDLYPSMKVLQNLSREKKKFEKLHKETDIIIQDIMNDHKTNHKEAGKDEDLVDVLFRIQKENEDSPNPLTDDHMKAVIQDMFAAGGESSSTTVLWAMSEMVKNPKIMEKAQAEVRNLFDKQGYMDETELTQLIYLKSVIKETLRLHPPVPLLVPRQSMESSKINGYDIPNKTRVIVNAWAIGRDPNYWVDAESFKPERFIDSSVDFKGTDFDYIPFGAGRRMCPGIAFALPNIELPLAQLLYHFDWTLPNGVRNENLDMSESPGIAVGRKHDLCLIPIARRH